MMRLLPALLTLCAALPATLAQADDAVIAKALSATTVDERHQASAVLAAANDAASTYALGSILFFEALEGLALGLNRHGFESPRSMLLPLMRLPIPERAEPEPLTYEGLREILSAFREAMAEAAATLEKVPGHAEIGIEVDLGRLAIDLDGDGKLTGAESIAGIMAALQGPRGGMPPALVFRFDRADGYWLQGYANLLMAQADFWLAHDFRNAFDGSFHMLFPRAGLPLQNDLVPAPGTEGAGGLVASEWRIADFISFIHLVNWPVIEPERRKRAREHILEMIRLSRENWKSIRAETDNDREWLPGPQQSGAHALTGLEVGEEQVTAWHDTLQMAVDILEGRALVPHFRFADRGIDMKRFFDEPQTFDLVLAITGPGIVPYLRSGRVLTAEEWNALTRRFGDRGILPFAIWFN